MNITGTAGNQSVNLNKDLSMCIIIVGMGVENE
jgi:hypothetical protein